jgi:phosphoenolpyruvate synthase/pyruvate phosphate dikinase
MECEALKRVRNDMGLTNVEIMVPFVRTVKQAERVVARCWPTRASGAGPTACA